VIALTGDAMRETRDLCTAAGMDAFVVKPVDRHALAAALTRTLAPRPA
jgi:CheY-like chemotaxis protein